MPVLVSTLSLSGADHSILWWLIENSDENGRVSGAWMKRAAAALKYGHLTVMRAKRKLSQAGLIETRGRERWVKIRPENFAIVDGGGDDVEVGGNTER